MSSSSVAIGDREYAGVERRRQPPTLQRDIQSSSRRPFPRPRSRCIACQSLGSSPENLAGALGEEIGRGGHRRAHRVGTGRHAGHQRPYEVGEELPRRHAGCDAAERRLQSELGCAHDETLLACRQAQRGGGVAVVSRSRGSPCCWVPSHVWSSMSSSSTCVHVLLCSSTHRDAAARACSAVSGGPGARARCSRAARPGCVTMRREAERRRQAQGQPCARASVAEDAQ